MQPAPIQDPRGITREKVTEVIATVVSRMGDKLSSAQVKIAWELEQLAKQIDGLYEELSSFNASAIKGNHLPKAHDELAEVVQATADATSTIMDACDVINKAAEGLPPEKAEAITGGVMNIYEACSFQDITGQRITKVVKTLKVIEERIDSLIQTIGANANPELQAAVDAQNEATLLNGPSAAGQGISQDEIDKLLGF